MTLKARLMSTLWVSDNKTPFHLFLGRPTMPDLQNCRDAVSRLSSAQPWSGWVQPRQHAGMMSIRVDELCRYVIHVIPSCLTAMFICILAYQITTDDKVLSDSAEVSWWGSCTGLQCAASRLHAAHSLSGKRFQDSDHH